MAPDSKIQTGSLPGAWCHPARHCNSDSMFITFLTRRFRQAKSKTTYPLEQLCCACKSTIQNKAQCSDRKEGMKNPSGLIVPKLRNIDEEVERWWLSLSSNLGPSL